VAGPVKLIRRTLLVCLFAAAIACGGEGTRAGDLVSAQAASRKTSGPKWDFSMTVSPAAQSVADGTSVSYTVDTVTTQGHWQQVILSISDLPAGVTATFDPATITSGQSSTLQLSASTSAVPATAQFTVTGTGTNATRTATATVSVVDQIAPSISILAPADGAVLAGPVSISVSASDNIAVARAEIYLDGVLFSTAGSAVWDTTAATDGLHAISATAYDTSGNSATSPAVTVTVQNGPATRDFAISLSPATSTVPNRGSATYAVTTSTVVGAAQPLSIDVQGLPPGVSATVTPANVISGESATVTVSAADGAAAGSSIFSVQATGVYTSHAAQTQLTVIDTIAPSVALGPLPQVLSGAVRVDALAADNTGVVRTEIWLDGSLAVAAASLIWDTTTAGDGAHALEARAYDAAGNVGTTGPIAVTVQNSAATRDFSIEVTPASQSVKGGATALYTITARTVSGAPQPVDLSIAGLPQGVTASFASTQILSGASTTVTLSAAADAPAVSTDFSVFATGVYATRNATAGVNVIDAQAPTIALTSPAAGAQLSGTVQVAATAQDNTAVVAVEILLDGAVVASAATFDWDTTASLDGPHVLEAHAYDAAGNLGSTGSVQVAVQNNAATRSFAASISPPAASFPDTGSASFTVSTQTLAGAPQPLTIAARFADGAPREIGATVTPAFATSGDAGVSVVVSSPGHWPGSATLLVDVCGVYACQTVSASVNVIDTIPPVVTFSAPLDGAVLSGTSYVLASASDAFLSTLVIEMDGVPSGLSPNNQPWDTTAFADGLHTLTAVATDTSGNVTTVSHVVTIQNSPATRDFLFSSPDGVEMVVSTGVSVQFQVSSSEVIGAPETLQLSASVPAGIAVSIDPPAIQAGQRATVTLTALSDSASGPVTISATGVYLTRSGTFTVKNSAASAAFGLVPAPATVGLGFSFVQVPIATVTLAGAPQPLRLQDPQTPPDVFAFFDPPTILSGETATLWVTALTTAPAGTYGVTLVATGSSETHSAVLQLTVRDIVPPQVEIIPLRGRILAGVVNVQAHGWDDVGVVRSELDVDGQLAASADGSPLTYAWDTRAVADGNHHLDARVWDGGGNMAKASATMTVLNAPASHDLVLNGSFEEPDTSVWTAGGTVGAVRRVIGAYDGSYSLSVGDDPTAGTSTASQRFWIPSGATSAQLSFWVRGIAPSGAPASGDWQEAALYDASGSLIETIFHEAVSTDIWTQKSADLAAWAGNVVELRFTVQSSAGPNGSPVLYVDSVTLPVSPDGVGSAAPCLGVGSVLYLDGDPGDRLSSGKQWLQADVLASMTPTANGIGMVSVSATPITGSPDWRLAQFFLDPLAAGKIREGATQDVPPYDLPGLRVEGSNLLCAPSIGRFQIQDLSLDGLGNLSSFTATFEQSCFRTQPVLRGCVRYQR